MIVDTRQGKVEGTSEQGVEIFRGIPFAAPPTGPARFRPPAPAEPWTGIRPCRVFGPAVPQLTRPASDLLGGMAPHGQSERDCLTLNVWTPDAEGALPVMVFIHGGAFTAGTGGQALYDGTRLAGRQDVVVVTLNYRLGALGYLYLGELLGEDYAEGNVGLLDQIAALAWVRDNIAAFGGDPENVTVFGESAGAMSIGALLAMPAARGLFHKAVMQSGGAELFFDRATATGIARRYLDLLGLGADRAAELLDLPAERLLQAHAELVLAMRENGPLALPFVPVVDGTTILAQPLGLIREGSAAGIPLLIGTNRDEGRLFVTLDPLAPEVDEAAATRAFAASFADPRAALEVYRAHEEDTTPAGLLAAYTGDFVFHQPTERLAEAQSAVHPEVWRYLFTWPSPAFDGAAGSTHALDLPFVFDTVEVGGLRLWGEEAPPQALAELMSAAWAAFARDGRPAAPDLPDWPRFDADTRATMILDLPPRLLDDPRAVVNSLWRKAR